MYTLDQVKGELIRRIETLCRTFLPGGTVQGTLYKCAGIGGGQGKSFVVHLSGEHAGDWVENNSDAAMSQYKGRVFDLWRLLSNEPDVGKAKQKAIEWLGLDKSFALRRYQAPAPKAEETFKRSAYSPVDYESRARDYLCEERSLQFSTLQKYGVGAEDVWFHETGAYVPAILFPLNNASGEIKGMKYLAIDRIKSADGKDRKILRAEKHSEYHLFGMGTVPKDATTLVICEGEIDAMTVHDCGFNAVSVPFGAHADSDDGRPNASNKWIQNDYDFLERFDDIKVLMDSDETGQAAARTIIKRLGNARCSLVKLPEGCKDPNQMLTEGKEQQLIDAINAARPQDPEKLVLAEALREDVYKEFFGGPETTRGVPMLWNMPFHIRLGEVTVVSGYMKHGKTVWLTHLVVDLCARYGWRTGIASLEMPARKTLRNMIRQLTGKEKPVHQDNSPDMDLFDRCMCWLNDRVYIYDAVGTAELKDLLFVFSYLAKRYGVQIFIIDSLMRLNVAGDDLDRQKDVMNKLAEFAAEYRVHVFLVAHSKKPNEKKNEKNYAPTSYDINGSAAIPNIAHNVLVVYRNIAKEEALQLARTKGDFPKEQALLTEPDAFLYVRAQREGDGERPMKALWYDAKGSWQFRDVNSKPVIQYIK